MFSQANNLGIYEELAAYRIGDFVLPEQSVLVDAGTCPMLDQPLPAARNRPARSRDSLLEFTFSYSALSAPCVAQSQFLDWAIHPFAVERGLGSSANIKQGRCFEGDNDKAPMPSSRSLTRENLASPSVPGSGRGRHKRLRPFVKSENRYHLPTRGKR